MANPSDETTTDEMIGQSLLPVQGCVASPVQAEPQTPQKVGVRLWVLRRQLHVEAPGTLGEEVRPGHVVDHDLIPRLAFHPRAALLISSRRASKGGVLA